MKTLATATLLTLSVSLLAAGTAFQVRGQDPAPTVVHDFVSMAGSMDSMILGSDGHFYGTTRDGPGEGSVFRRTASGTYTTLATFTGSNGQCPNPRLVEAPDGNFYGATFQGGTHESGTLFRITPGGILTTLHHFAKTDGSFPWSLTLGSDGDLYGTTVTGTNYTGTVFKITTSGTFTSLASIPASFVSFPAGLTEGPDGNFYGTTFNGSTRVGRFYSVTRAGVVTALATLNGQNTWYSANLTLGSDGDFYGTTMSGGSSNRGTVFKATTAGTVTILTHFDGYNGFWPCGGLREGSDGSFYGTTMYGIIIDPLTSAPANQDGTVFSVTPAGTLTTLARFASPSNGGTRLDGARPYGGVCIGPDGHLYGTTICGGAQDTGVIFRVEAGLTPPARTTATSPSTAAESFAVLSEPAGQTSDTGATVTFNVAAQGKGLRYRWLKNGRPLSNTTTKTVTGATTSTLTLNNVGMTAAGSFSVIVVSGRQRITTKPVLLRVNFADADSDGVSNDKDKYPGTEAGSAVNRNGASIAQLVPASGPVTGGTWKTYNHYLAALTRVATAFRTARLITAKDGSALIRAAIAAKPQPPAVVVTGVN